jgi:hypothetical protein
MQQLTKHPPVVSEPAGYPRVIEVGYRFSKDFDGINPPRLVQQFLTPYITIDSV